jgi:WhiB family redox-sensing transcriptional regulator
METRLFFPSESGWTGVVQAERAKAVCQGCTVRAECLSMAMADSDLRGIWGGTTWHERRDARKAAHSEAREHPARTRQAAALIAARDKEGQS